MSRRANPAAVGGFVLVGLALAVAGILVLGGGRLFTRTHRYVIFFDGSVNGLSVGAPVRVGGVQVGQVLEIDAIVDASTWKVVTQTVIEIDPERIERRGVARDARIPPRELIEHGLRARLETQSLLTGQLYVELSFRPDTEARLVGGDIPYPEIPSLPTTVQEIEAQVRKVIAQLSTLPLEDIVNHLNDSLAGVDRLVNDPSIPKALANLESALARADEAIASITRLSRRADGQIGPVVTAATDTLDDAQRAIEELRSTFASDSPLSYQLSVTLGDLNRAIRAVQALARELERNPRSLLFGRASEER